MPKDPVVRTVNPDRVSLHVECKLQPVQYNTIGCGVTFTTDTENLDKDFKKNKAKLLLMFQEEIRDTFKALGYPAPF